MGDKTGDQVIRVAAAIYAALMYGAMAVGFLCVIYLVIKKVFGF